MPQATSQFALSHSAESISSEQLEVEAMADSFGSSYAKSPEERHLLMNCHLPVQGHLCLFTCIASTAWGMI